MIQINLVPDVKQELLRAQRQQALVISLSVLASAVAVGVVVLLGAYVLVQQGIVNRALDKSIKDLSGQIESKEGLPNALTIQNQLSAISDLHDKRIDSSRLFDLLTAISPESSNKNAINVSKLSLDSENHLVTIEAQAKNGYEALEAFKKTIKATNVTYLDNQEEVTTPLTDTVADGDRSYGEDANNRKVLRFTISFEYPENLLATTTTNVKISAPKSQINVTDSKINVPSSLFSERVNSKEAN